MTGPAYIDFTRFSRTPSATPPSDAQVVTPSDSADLPGGPCRALFLSAAGDVKVTTVGGTVANVTLKANAAGSRVDLRCTRVWATGTTVTAGNVIALY